MVEELKPKEILEGLAALFIFIGIIILVGVGLYYLGHLLNGPTSTLFTIIGNIVINVFKNIPLIFIVILIAFMAAGILLIGTLLKDELDQTLYLSTTLAFWIFDLIILFLVGLYIMSTSTTTYIATVLGTNPGDTSIPTSLIVGATFTLFIAPPFAFIIIKGIISLIKHIKKDV